MNKILLITFIVTFTVSFGILCVVSPSWVQKIDKDDDHVITRSYSSIISYSLTFTLTCCVIVFLMNRKW
jgi:uncharacterized BrkB/YihY/UPF0761 family membrane protein|uniref:Uncharacterized protein n=1 Tax=viral metagenome TaxID=1070528 RepID=A0A6C0LW08_9ZZZZ